MAGLRIGGRVPTFSLPDQHGKRRSLKDFAGRMLVLYFFPGRGGDACRVEACQFRDHHPDFSKIKVAVVGISPDSVESLRAMAAAHAIDFPLLSDAPADGRAPATCSAYGVWAEKTMYGRRYAGVVRTTLLIDGDGVLRARWDRVKVRGHAAAVLREAKRLAGLGDGAVASKKQRKGVRDMDPPFPPSRGTRTRSLRAAARPSRVKSNRPIARVAARGGAMAKAGGRSRAGGRRG